MFIPLGLQVKISFEGEKKLVVLIFLRIFHVEGVIGV